MKKYILLTVLVLCSTSIAFSQMSDIKSAIMENEKAIYEAIKSGDMKAFKSHTADDMMAVYSWGISDKSDEVESLSKMKMNAYELSDVRVMQPTDDVAIIIYSLSAEGSYDDKPFSGDYYATSTWVNMNGTWKAILHTEMEKSKEMMDDDMDQ